MSTLSKTFFFIINNTFRPWTDLAFLVLIIQLIVFGSINCRSTYIGCCSAKIFLINLKKCVKKLKNAKIADS